jgi:hypothetical protein
MVSSVASGRLMCDAVNIHEFGAPNNTPGEIVEKLDKEANATLVDPKMKHGRSFATALPSKAEISAPPQHVAVVPARK